jgi:endogenous inhibitor of DNA gyrase (YacG/DUF329 family)
MKIESVNCVHCGKEFVRQNPRKKLCSDKCKHDSWYSKEENRIAKHKRSLTWLSRNPDRNHAKKLKHLYKMTIEQYKSMESDQNGVCKICKRVCPSGRKLSVDHCHISGKIRGLLCMKCNKGLGSFEDNMENMKIAIQYLEEHKP